MRLETERLILRPLALSDADGFVPLIANWNVAKTLARVPHPYHRSDFEQFFNMQGQRQAEGHEPGLGICLKDGPDHAIGSCGIHLDRSGKEGVGTLGYWIGEPYWGRGLMTEAVRAVIEDGFTRRDLVAIEAGFLTANLASGRILEKVGFEITGTGLDYSLANDAKLPATFVRLSRENWQR